MGPAGLELDGWVDGKSSWKVKAERSGPGGKVKSREGVGRKRTRISRDMNENIWEAGNYILVRLSVGVNWSL